jgi:thrombospondin type 3 repeat protein
MMVNAADVATRVEGEDFDVQPTGTKVVTDTAYYAPPNSEALKFTNNTAIAEETVKFANRGDIVLWARGGQPNGSPTLSVNVDGGVFSPAQTITNNKVPVAYTYDLNVSVGSHTIGVKAGNTGTERYPFLDFVTFPASGSGGTDPGGDRDADGIPDASDNCPDVYNPQQADDDRDGVGNKCDSGSTPPTDTDGDGVPDSTDQCDTQPGPAPSGCPLATSSAILVGAGDISSGGSRDQETGDLVRAELSRGAWGVFTTGDNAYPYGTYQNYQVYDEAWGSFRNKTRPTYGNHEYYGSSTAVGSEQYWNEGPDPTPVRVSNAASYFAYEVANSNWRAIVLNSASTEGPTSNQAPSCAAGSPQMTFLNNALNTTKNTVLFWHHARFSASSDHPTSEGATGCSKMFFDVAYDKRADLILQGHSHLYERYDTRDKSGQKVAGGLTSIVCGLGGNSFDGLQGSPSPAYDRAFTNAWGVCKLSLNTNNAQVTFLPAPGSPGTDSATVAVRP